MSLGSYSHSKHISVLLFKRKIPSYEICFLKSRTEMCLSTSRLVYQTVSDSTSSANRISLGELKMLSQIHQTFPLLSSFTRTNCRLMLLRINGQKCLEIPGSFMI